MKDIKEDYVSFKTAKLLKDNGFNVMCGSMYMPDVRHNGRSISFDEELDLNDAGRGGEIKVVEGGTVWDVWNINSYNSENGCSRPSVNLAWKWFLCGHGIEIHPFITSDGWKFEIGDVRNLDTNGSRIICKSDSLPKKPVYKTYNKAVEAAMIWYINNMLQTETV